MKINSVIRATCACLLSITVTPVVASVIYTYSGNSFDTFSDPSSYTTGMAVTGTVELAAPLVANLPSSVVAPISFSFSDGINTITSTNASDLFIELGTDGLSGINQWNIQVYRAIDDGTEFGKQYSIFTTFIGVTANDYGRMQICEGGPCGFDSVTDAGYQLLVHGSWSGSLVPVPAAAWLFGSGLIGLIGFARRKNA